PTARRLSAREEATAAQLRLRDRALLEVLYGAGLRVSECVALDVGDLETGRHKGAVLIHVRRGKGDKTRVVPLGQAGIDAIEAWLAVRPGAGALFVNARGTRLTTRSVQRMVKRWVRVAGVDQ